MGIFDIFTKSKESQPDKKVDSITEIPVGAENVLVFGNAFPRTNNIVIKESFDGEKTPGELGNIYDLQPEYHKLRMRAYEMDLKTDLIKIITGKIFKWIIGTGLKLQSECDYEVLNMLGYNVQEDSLEQFKTRSEHLFNLWAKSKLGDYSEQQNIHQKGNDAFKTAFLGGDALVILRYSKSDGVTVQLIDGEQIQSPLDDAKKSEGNEIKYGVEVDKRGRHVAYWVKVDGTDLEYKRITVKSNGIKRAWLIYGYKHRIDHVRGIPAITSIIEKVSKLDRFTEASVSKAEQVANIPFAIEHDRDSTGENPLANLGPKKNLLAKDETTSYDEAGKTANQIRQSTSNQVFNMPIGAKLKTLANESETNFDEFYKAIFRSLCAAVDVPPEVALQMYEQSYSSSRAAINMWEHIIEIWRDNIIVNNYYKPIYKFWLYHQMLEGKIENEFYEKAINEKDVMALEAFYNCRLVGKKMPHIDPLKEAKAIRDLLQDDTPLISREQAAEMANAGDWNQNYAKFKNERKEIDLDAQVTKNKGYGVSQEGLENNQQENEDE